MTSGNWILTIILTTILTIVLAFSWTVNGMAGENDRALRTPSAEIQQSALEARMAGYVRHCFTQDKVLRVWDARCSEYVSYIKSELDKNERALVARGL